MKAKRSPTKTPTPKSTAKKPPSKKLLACRDQIDGIDQQLVALLCKRAWLARAIGDEKQALGLPIFERSREAAVLAKVEKLRQPPLEAAGLARIYRAIMLTMRHVQVTRLGEPKRRQAASSKRPIKGS